MGRGRGGRAWRRVLALALGWACLACGESSGGASGEGEVFEAATDEAWGGDGTKGDGLAPSTAWQALESIVDDLLQGELPPSEPAAEVHAHLAQDPSWYVILDVRPAATFAAGHLPGAHNLGLDEIAAWGEAHDPGAGLRVLVVCQAGQQSAWAVALLRLAGFDARSLRWGMPGWSTLPGNLWAAGCSDQAAALRETGAAPEAALQASPPLAGDPSAPEALVRERLAAVWAGGFKLQVFESVASRLSDYTPVALADEDEYAAGHLPGAVRLAPGALDDTSGLRFLPPDRPLLLTSCSGEASAYVAALLNVLGYDATTLKFGANALWHSELATCAWSGDLSAGLPVVTGP